jgi:hypothetical protein
MNKAYKPVKYIDGVSEGGWKSLVVKSLRIGWPQGLEEASKRLQKSDIKNLLIAGLFEDVFPASMEELDECVNEINRFDFHALCSRETHHGRNHSEAFCDLENEACTTGKLKGPSIVAEIARNTQLKFITPRVYNCLYTWWKINPTDGGVMRPVLDHPFTGIPKNILDGHTKEGREARTYVLLLSGHYANHRLIGQRVMKEGGWSKIREEFINDPIAVKMDCAPKQLGLF